jgi:dGTPase
VADADEVRAFPRRLAAFTAEAAETSSALKQFLFAKVYASVALGQDRQQSMTMLGELFRFFLDHPDRLPPPYCQQALAEPAHRVVCDYIAGMTDSFFRRTYEQTVGGA